ncbi:hypothetical protein G3A43_08340 [Paraburkholderia aspalathi]|nr:hypothetical protein [Paraburkholderia aspalathi]MBK3780265.1 hypothetical protein [Paraburkholderia aspalathi]
MNINASTEQFSMRCRSAAQLTRIRRAGFSIVAVVMLGFFVKAMIITARPGTAYVKDYPGFFVAFLLVCALSMVMASFQWLPDQDCDALASLCERHPSLMGYRNKVCAAGRRFTLGECAAMERWAEIHEQETRETLAAVAVAERRREGHQRLYGAPPVSQT